jgi:hypothetical protein
MHPSRHMSPASFSALAQAVRSRWPREGAFLFALLAGVGGTLALVLTWRAALHERDLLTALIADDQAPPVVAFGLATGDAREEASFVDRLPLAPEAFDALRIVESAAQRHAVSVSSQHVQRMTPLPERLGRVDVTVAAQGRYADVKSFLAEVSDRVVASTIARLRLQRIEDRPGIELRLTLSVWSQPVQASARP